jgi:hypothetical protein
MSHTWVKATPDVKPSLYKVVQNAGTFLFVLCIGTRGQVLGYLDQHHLKVLSEFDDCLYVD